MVPILKEHIPGIWNWQEAEGDYISGRGRTSNCEFSKVNALREKEIKGVTGRNLSEVQSSWDKH